MVGEPPAVTLENFVSMGPPTNATALLNRMSEGDEAAGGELLGWLYGELRRLARSDRGFGGSNATEPATAIVNEAYMRLFPRSNHVEWANRRHFFAAAAKIMRQIRIDDARRKKRLKRGGDRKAVTLDAEPMTVDPDQTEPGICGCGTADSDTDGDATVDCEDDCPNHASKTEPGVCGCDFADDIDFVGFLPPIDGADATGGSFANPLRAFKLGSTIPVKFMASQCGDPLYDGVHTLAAVKYSSAVDCDAPIDATPTDEATTGNQFRLADGEWHFNLSTRSGFSQGTWKLIATLSDESTHEVWITIKK
jgi:DNA-directed RNA polymerase specialized sigma24 family protein